MTPHLSLRRQFLVKVWFSSLFPLKKKREERTKIQKYIGSKEVNQEHGINPHPLDFMEAYQ